MNKKIICVNGPPRSGKDTVYSMIKNLKPNIRVVREKFAKPLDNIAQAVMNMDDATFRIYREEKKDEALPDYPDVTMRKLLIYSSEDYCKILFGQDYFAVQAFNRIKQNIADIIVITDSGFQIEFDRLCQMVNDSNIGEVKLVRLYRPNHTFDNDSREYVETPGHIIQNDKTIWHLREKVANYLKNEKI